MEGQDIPPFARRKGWRGLGVEGILLRSPLSRSSWGQSPGLPHNNLRGLSSISSRERMWSGPWLFPTCAGVSWRDNRLFHKMKWVVDYRWSRLLLYNDWARLSLAPSRRRAGNTLAGMERAVSTERMGREACFPCEKLGGTLLGRSRQRGGSPELCPEKQ